MVKRSEKSGVDEAKKLAKAKAVKAPPPPVKPPPEKPPTTQAEINRIGDIIRNARGTWFGLLGALVFAAVTLASVKDASFFIPSEQTKLPLLGISVPITSFFWAGALLVTALYTYLHLYLVQLWDALGDADPQFEEKPLADVIHPWLVSDAALRVRDSLRKTKDDEHCSRQRGMSSIGTLVSILLVWLFGLITIGWFWWRSMPAHDIWLTGWLGALFAWTLFIFWQSSCNALKRLGKIKYPIFPNLILYGACLLVICGLSYVRTHYDIWEGESREMRSYLDSNCHSKLLTSDGDIDENLIDLGDVGNMDLLIEGEFCPTLSDVFAEFLRPARAEMAETVFTQKPSSWKGYDLAKQEFRKSWCKQIVEKVCEINPLDENPQFDEKVEKKFEEAWKIQLEATLASFSKPDLRGKRLEGADLRFAQLEGLRLDKARLQGANLSGAEMQGAVLTQANMQGAVLREANMQGAVLLSAEMQRADLRLARMQEANLTLANMQGADLTEAKMQGAVLLSAEMQRADLRLARMQGAVLFGAEMQGANLRVAQMQGANLSYAEMQGADLTGAEMQGTSEEILKLESTNLEQANFSASSLRFVDFTGAYVVELRNFEKSFGDGSVKLAEGMTRPSSWCDKALSDEQYWGRYQGWMEKHELGNIKDKEILQYPIIPFGTPCPE